VWAVALGLLRRAVYAYLPRCENGLFAPFIYKKSSFYQDRLGTNIGKAPKKPVFSKGLTTTAAISTALRTIGGKNHA
jgi:hypothetical protein